MAKGILITHELGIS